MRIASRWMFAAVMTLGLGGAVGCFKDPSGPGSQGPATREEVLGIVCQAQLAVTGQFEPSAAQPADVFGCWPVGTWRFHARVESNDCAQAPNLEQEYAVTVSRDLNGENETYVYVNNPTYDRMRLKVSSGGGGLCEGGFEIFSPDGKSFLNLKPALNADGTITGFGEYEVYGSDQF